MGVTVEQFDAAGATAEDIASLKELVYRERIVVLKGQDISAAEFVELGRRFGKPEVYYEPMYRHPEHEEIFVSSNVATADGRVGVPRTGEFWHADYQFMPRPFGLTMVYPQVVPAQERGTYYIDMAKAYQRLSPELREKVDGTVARHSARRYFKIRPSDVYRPIQDVLEDIERKTPPVSHPTVFEHPVTGEPVLYISAAFTYAIEGREDDLVTELLTESGQLDASFEREDIHLQFLHKGDLLIWDNRALVHRARHADTSEPAASYRITVHDEHPFHPALAERPATVAP
ncbi:TauD/TfdA dioxygenase family protein [Kitasatospora sp. NPDC052896]|uniref:(3R)-3-[(carboxymethyl)amino]fatty acid oxygenase/decarboxylase n=1 Tax=Kitasatospora sp. NPDC052896 TaxID=3364061 RepID=UPI0037C6F994